MDSKLAIAPSLRGQLFSMQSGWLKNGQCGEWVMDQK